MDGRLDESVYEQMQPASDFVQQVPREGALATERTETWVMFDNTYELLSRPFTVSPGMTIPIGSYPFSDVTTSYGFGQQRRVSGTVSLQRGRFYNGEFFVVYTDERDTLARGYPDLKNRAFVVKINRLLRF